MVVKKGLTVLKVTGILSALTAKEINWQPWLGYNLLADYEHADILTRFESPAGFEWYLGERVTHQSFGFPKPRISLSPPFQMWCSKLFQSDVGHERAMRWFDARGFLRNDDYDEFIQDVLMQSFATRVPHLEEEFINIYSRIARLVPGQETIYDLHGHIDLIDSHGVLTYHRLPIPPSEEISLPSGDGPIPREVAQRYVSSVNATRAFSRRHSAI